MRAVSRRRLQHPVHPPIHGGMSAPSTTVTSRDDILLFGESTGPLGSIGTPAVIATMLDAGSGISDLIFPPGRPPQAEVHGELVAVRIPSLPMLRAEDTAQIARDLIDGNEYALRTLRDQGACDLSYSVPERARFRVNV